MCVGARPLVIFEKVIDGELGELGVCEVPGDDVGKIVVDIGAIGGDWCELVRRSGIAGRDGAGGVVRAAHRGVVLAAAVLATECREADQQRDERG